MGAVATRTAAVNAPVQICRELAESRDALKFDLPDRGPAFVVRWHGKVYGYLNQCAHVGGPIDFEGQVLERSGRFLMCARHGAIYEPDTGLCVGGPCKGAHLVALPVSEAADGSVWLEPG